MSHLQKFNQLTQIQKNFLKENLKIVYIADQYSQTKETINLYKCYDTYIAIPLPYVAYLKKCKIEDDYKFSQNNGPNDDRILPLVMSKFYTQTYQLWSQQKEVVDDAMIALKNRRTCILKLPCSFGKTIMSIYIAHKLGLKTMVIVHRGILVEQWKLAVEKFTNLTVQIITGETTCLQSNAGFYIVTPIIASKKEPPFFDDIGTLILDECHALCTPAFMQGLFNIFPKYAISLSATPYRKDNMHQVIFSCFGRNLIERISFRKFLLYRLDTNVKPRIERNFKRKINWNTVIESLGENDVRNHMIVETTQKFKDKYILIICKRINHVKLLQQMIEKIEADSTSIMIGTMTKYDLTRRILISTYSKLGVGFDDPRLNLEILADSCTEVEQVAGRVFRDKKNTPIIIDMVDNFPTLEKHWNMRKEWYLNSGAENVNILELDGFETNKQKISKKKSSQHELINPNEIIPTKRLRKCRNM